jgi:hypothetical protein
MDRTCNTNVEEKPVYKVLVGNQKERDHVGGWLILKWILDMIGLHGLD